MSENQVNTYLLPSANQTFDSTQFHNIGTCVPGRYYQWGFSVTLLTTFLVTTLVLAIWLSVVWLCTFQCDRQDSDQVFGELVSALQVAAAIRQDLGDMVDSDMTESDIRNALKRRGNLGIPARRYRETRKYVAKSSAAVHITALAPEDCPPAYAGRGM